MNYLPEELILNIVTYLNYKNEEIINCRILDKSFKEIIEKPITIDGYPDVIQTSLWYFSIDYLLYRNSIQRQVIEANKEFDNKYLNMLIDEGWL